MRIRQLTLRDLLAPFLIAWLSLFYVTSFELPQETTASLYEARRLIAFVVLAGLTIIFFQDLQSERTPRRALLLAVPVCLSFTSLMIGSIDLNLFLILVSSYLFGIVNIAENRIIRNSFLWVVFASAAIGILTADLYTYYVDGRARLSFGLATPTTLAIFSGIAIILTGFKTPARTIISCTLVCIVILTETRSVLGALLLLALFNRVMWDRSGRIRKLSLNLFLGTHVAIVCGLLVLVVHNDYSELSYWLNDISSGRLFIWSNAASTVGVWGGIDPNINWLKLGEDHEAEHILNRASIDGFYILRWLESGLLFMPEYALLIYLIAKAAPRSSMKESAIIFSS